MVGGEHHLPRVLTQQEQLQPDAPLQGVDVAARAIPVGDDSAPGLHLGVVVEPLAPVDVAQDGGQRPIGGHRHRRPEHDLADIGRELGMGGEVIEQLGRPGAKLPPGPPAVAVKLQMGEVRLASRQRAHRLKRRVGVAGHPEVVVAVDVDRMGQPELVHRPADRLQHLARGHAEARHLVIERVDVAVVLLEDLYSAGIDELHPVGARRLQPPRHRVAQVLGRDPAGTTDQLEDDLVVAEQDQEQRIDQRRVAQLREHVTRRQRRHGRLDDRRVPKQRIAVAGDERAGYQVPRCPSAAARRGPAGRRGARRAATAVRR